MGGMESCVSQHYVTPGATSLPMGEYVQVPPDMGGHPCTPAMSSYLESLPPGVGMPEYPWMKEKKTVRKPAQQGESSSTFALALVMPYPFGRADEEEPRA